MEKNRQVSASDLMGKIIRSWFVVNYEGVGGRDHLWRCMRCKSHAERVVSEREIHN